jgi:hypothetical protein
MAKMFSIYGFTTFRMNKFFSKVRLFILAAFVVLIGITVAASGCSLLNRDKQSIAEKKSEEAEKKANAEYEKALKQHYNHQSKDAKKMMKNTKKQAAKVNKPKKRKWFAGTKCK